MAAANLVYGPFTSGEEQLLDLFDLCGIPRANGTAFLMREEGLTEIRDLHLFTSTEIDNLQKRWASRTVASGRLRIGMLPITLLKAAVYWTKRRVNTGLDTEFNSVTRHDLEECAREMSFVPDATNTTASSLYPEKFTYKKVKVWISTVLNYLDALMARDGRTPLRYILRTGDPPATLSTEAERLKWAAPLLGPVYEVDNSTVYQIIFQLTVGTEAQAWVKQAKEGDGRGAWTRLMSHYLNPGNVNTNINEAKARLDALHYRNEIVFPFEKYFSAMKEAYADLDGEYSRLEDGSRIPERDKIDRLVSQMHPRDGSREGGGYAKNIQLQVAIGAARSMPTFIEAGDHLQGQVSLIFKGAHGTHQRNKRNIHQLERGRGRGRGRARTGGRGGRGRGRGDYRGRGRGRGRGRNATWERYPTQVGGVDVTDPTRTFSDTEWETLMERGFVPRLYEERQRVNGQQGQRGNDTSRQISALEEQVNQLQDQLGQRSNDQQQQSSERGGTAGSSMGRGRYENNRA